MSLRRVLTQRPAVIGINLVDQDGAPRIAADTLDVTTTLLDGSTLPDRNASDLADGNYSISYSGTELASTDSLTIAVTDTGNGAIDTFVVDVVGGFFFSLAEARTIDPSLSDLDRYPDEDVIRIRQEVEDECEIICGQAFVPRATTITVDGSGDRDLLLDLPIRTVRSGSVSGIALTSDDIAGFSIDEVGLIHRSAGLFTCGVANVSLVVEYGRSGPPADLKVAAIRRLRERLNSPVSNVPSRATSIVQEGNTFSIAVPGRAGFETGNPEVDAVYARYRWAPVLA